MQSYPMFTSSTKLFQKYSSSFKCSTRIWCYVIAFFVVLISACIAEYGYLTSLYLVDEVYEVKIPKEIGIHEKITLRTVAAENSAALKKFVEHYSICQNVYEIQVVWPTEHSSSLHPSAPRFVYTKTHSLVHVDPVPPGKGDIYHMMLYHQRKINTESK